MSNENLIQAAEKDLIEVAVWHERWAKRLSEIEGFEIQKSSHEHFAAVIRAALAEAKKAVPKLMPSGIEFSEANRLAVTNDWVIGWNACRQQILVDHWNVLAKSPVSEPAKQTRSQKLAAAGFTKRKGIDCDECGKELDGTLQAQLHECEPAEQQGDPSAYTDEDFMEIYVSEDIAKENSATVKLYTRPQRLKAEPLTEEQAQEIISGWLNAQEDEMSLIRLTEFAHGIAQKEGE